MTPAGRPRGRQLPPPRPTLERITPARTVDRAPYPPDHAGADEAHRRQLSAAEAAELAARRLAETYRAGGRDE